MRYVKVLKILRQILDFQGSKTSISAATLGNNGSKNAAANLRNKGSGNTENSASAASTRNGNNNQSVIDNNELPPLKRKLPQQQLSQQLQANTRG